MDAINIKSTSLEDVSDSSINALSIRKTDSAESVTMAISELFSEIAPLKTILVSAKMDTGEMPSTTNALKLMFLVTGTTLTQENVSTAHPTTTCKMDHVSPTRTVPTGNFTTMETASQFPWPASLSSPTVPVQAAQEETLWSVEFAPPQSQKLEPGMTAPSPVQPASSEN